MNEWVLRSLLSVACRTPLTVLHSHKPYSFPESQLNSEGVCVFVHEHRDTLTEPLFSTQAICWSLQAKFSLSAPTPISNLCLYKEAHCHHSRLCFLWAKPWCTLSGPIIKKSLLWSQELNYYVLDLPKARRYELVKKKKIQGTVSKNKQVEIKFHLQKSLMP